MASLPTHAKAVVIGGGVVGCSVLYHLAKLGWKDVALLERKELTSGSSWHAAGMIHTINADPNIARLQDYTINLYRRDRGDLGPVLRHPSARRHLSRLDAGAPRLSEAGARQGPLYGAGDGLHLARGSAGAEPPDRSQQISGRAVRAGRRPCRSLRRHPCLSPRRPSITAQRSIRETPVLETQRAGRWRLGGGHPQRHHQRRSS